MVGRNRIAIVVAEFLGTGVLALAMLSVQHSAIGLPYFIAIVAGLTLAVMTVLFARTGDGAHFNPAITIGMWAARQVKTMPAIAYIVAQMLGAWAAYYIYTFYVHTSLQPTVSHFDWTVLIAEGVGALVLSLGYAAAVFNRFLNAKTAATIGAAYTLAIILASSASIGIVNPAIALSFRVFDVFGSSGWTNYALGPVLGAILGFLVYELLYAPETSLERVRTIVSERFVRVREAPLPASAPAKSETAAKPRTASKPRRSSRSSRSRSRSKR